MPVRRTSSFSEESAMDTSHDSTVTASAQARERAGVLEGLPRGRSLERLVRAVATESATSRSLIQDRTLAAVSPRVVRQFALHELIGCAEYMASGRTMSFKAQGSGLRASMQGLRLVGSLRSVGLQPLQGYAPLRRDPRLEEILGEVKALPAPVGVYGSAETVPDLNGLALRLHERLCAKRVLSRASRHRALDVAWFNDIRRYFSDIVRTVDCPKVARLELRGVQQPLAVIYPRTAARRANDLAATWLRRVHGTRRNGIVGLAWRLQYDDEDGFHHHVLLITQGAAQDDYADFHSRLEAHWRAVAGKQAWIMDCKADGIDLAYRGRMRHDGADNRMEDELSAAAAYFALAGTMEEFDFQADPPLRGFGARPRIRQPKVRELLI